MARSPLADSTGVLTFTVTSNGRRISEATQVVSIQVQRGVARVPSARLVIADGDAATDTWPVSDGADFVPGAQITIAAGYGDGEDLLFEGIVVKVGIQVSGENYSRLVVECRDKAVALTVGRRNANYVDQTDGGIIATLAAGAGLQATVDATDVTHRELVQYYCSDWDFLVSRAEVNGLLVIADDGHLKVKAPAVNAEPVLAVSYGADLIEFQAEIDARQQWASVEAVAWDPKQQAVLESGGQPPETLNVQGNLKSATLSAVIGLDALRLQTCVPLQSGELRGWSAAQQRRAGLARIRGRMKFQGHAAARPGVLIELGGMGARYDGRVFVGAVTHVLEDGNWFSEVDFGLAPDWFTERRDLVAPPAAGWLPGAEGLQIGRVLKLEGDPEGLSRIQIELPVMQAQTPGVWARLLQFHASSGFGAFFLPEIGDEVVVGHFNHDPSHPVVLGSLYSSQRKPPYVLEDKNDTKAIVTRCKARIEINEADKVVTIITPAKNQVVLSDKDKSILLSDQNGNKVELHTGGITLDSPKDIKIIAKGTIDIDAVGKISIASQADVAAKGLNIECTANVAFTAKGNASAELSASGQTTVRGALVMIN